MVDQDGSDQIEFDEFLSIIKGGNTSVSILLEIDPIEIAIEPSGNL